MNLISLDDFGFGQKLKESVMRAMVTHTTNDTELAELARPHGYSEGARLGVAVKIDHTTGSIAGSVMTLFGEDNPVVMEVKVPARRIWDTITDRKLDFSMTVRVSRVSRSEIILNLRARHVCYGFENISDG